MKCMNDVDLHLIVFTVQQTEEVSGQDGKVER